MEQTFAHSGFGSRLRTMLAVDIRRMFTQRFFYILFAVATGIPILVLVMTSMAGDPSQPGATFASVWQAIGSAGSAGMSMDLASMSNINLIYYLAAVLVGVFVTADFRSGYCKNLFAVRASKADYVLSKLLTCLLACALLLLGYFVGALLGGAIAGLSFEMTGFTAGNLVMCLLSKLLLMAIFVALYLLTAVIAKQKTWLALLLSFCAAMLLSNIIPMMTPLTATGMNVLLCLIGGVLFGGILGSASGVVLQKGDLL